MGNGFNTLEPTTHQKQLNKDVEFLGKDQIPPCVFRHIFVYSSAETVARNAEERKAKIGKPTPWPGSYTKGINQKDMSYNVEYNKNPTNTNIKILSSCIIDNQNS